MLNADRPTRVELHGPLGARFGREHLLYVSSPGEAMRALDSQHRGFRAAMTQPGACYALLAGDREIPIEAIRLETGTLDLHVVPIVEGNKDEFGQILMGVAIMVASYYTFGAAGWAVGAGMSAGTAAAFGTAFTGMGMSLAIGGIARLLSDAPGALSPNERPENKPSSLFSGPVNTISQNHPIQLCYGEVEIGSAVIATMLDNADAAYQPQAGEWGVAESALVEVSGGGTMAASSISTGSGFIRWTKRDGTIHECAAYSVEKGFGTTYTIAAGAKTLELGAQDQMVLQSGSYITASDLKVGDVLKTGDTITAAPVRNVRNALVAITVHSLLSVDPATPPGPEESDMDYMVVNGLPVRANVYVPLPPDDRNTEQ